MLFERSIEVSNRKRISVYEELSDNYIGFYFRGRCLSIDEFDNMHGFHFEKEPENFNIDHLVLLCEYIENMLVGYQSALNISGYGYMAITAQIPINIQLLLALADLLEPQSKKMNCIDDKFTSDLFYAFNNFNIRYNNVSPESPKYKKAIADLTQEQLEHWYDEIYQMAPLAFLQLEHVERKKEFDEIKHKIENKDLQGLCMR